MNNTIKYKYAKDHNQKIVEISTINKHDRNNSQYYCISCGKELIARLGEKNQHHFAHKSNADNVSILFSAMTILSAVFQPIK